MKKVVLLILVGVVSVWAEGKLDWSKHPNGQKYYSVKPVPGLKQNKLKWSEFAALYPKSWTYLTEIGWVLVDTPSSEEQPDKKPQIEFPRYIPPIRNGKGDLIVVESSVISPGPNKK